MDVSLSRPAPGERILVSIPNGELLLGFTTEEAIPARRENDLTLTFPDGGEVVVPGYFDAAVRPPLRFAGQSPQPDYLAVLEGTTPSDARQAAGEATGESSAEGTGESASRPAAPVAPATEASVRTADREASAPSPAVTSYSADIVKETQFRSDEDLDFLDGIWRLPGLDLGWNRGYELKRPLYGSRVEDRGEAGLPPNVSPAITAADAALYVDEGGVAGDRPDLNLGGPNSLYAGIPTAGGSAVATDPDGDVLIWQVVGAGGSGASAETRYGTVRIGPDGDYVYTLDESRSNILTQGEMRTDSFVVLVSDGRGGSAQQTVTVTITGTNDAPVLGFADGTTGAHTLSGRGAQDFGVIGALNVADPDSDGAPGQSVAGRPAQQFGISGVAGITGSGVQNADGGASFTIPGKGVLTVHPDGRYSFEYTGQGVAGDETFNFVVITTDAHGSVSNARDISVTLTPNRAPVITSTDHTHAVTEAGVAQGGNAPFDGTPVVSGRITATDADGDSPIYTLKDGSDGTKTGTYGTLTLDSTSGEYSYTLDNTKDATQRLTAGEAKNETFTVTVSDGHGDTTEQDITVTVTGANDRPELSIAGSGKHGLTDGGGGRAEGTFSVSDADADGLWAAGGSNANHSYAISAGSGTSGEAANGGLGGTSTFTTDYGTLTVKPDGTYTYTLNPASEKVIALGGGQSHTDEFVLKALDTHGAWSEQTVRVEITGKDDPPKISGATGAHEVVETGVIVSSNDDKPGTPTVSGSLSAEHSDGDQAGNVIAFGLSDSVHGPGGELGAVTLTDDGRKLQTDYGTLELKPTGQIAGGQYGCDYTFTLDNASDKVNSLAEGQTVTLRFQVQATDGSGPRTEELLITIKGSNDRPEITAIDRPSAVAEDGLASTSGEVTAADADAGDSLSYSLRAGDGGVVQILQGEYGRLEIIQSTGEYKYYLDNAKTQSLAEGQTGLDKFTVRVTDRWGAYAEQSLEIPITGKDDPPVLGNLSGSVTEDNGSHDAVPLPGSTVTTSGAVSVTDTDSIDTEKSFSLTGSLDASGSVSGSGAATDPYIVEGLYGTLTFKSDGSYTYTLRENATLDIQSLNQGGTVTDSFTINATTGHSGIAGVTGHSSSSTGTLVITIQGSNDNPVITGHDDLDVNQGDVITPTTSGKLAISDVDDTVTTGADGSITSANHSFYFDDGHGNRLQSWEGRFGVLTLNRLTGEYTYTVNQYAEGLGGGGTETFTVWVEDAHGGTASQEITVHLDALSVPPSHPGDDYTLTGDDLTVTEDDFASGTTNVQANHAASLSHGNGPFGFAVSVDGGSRFTQTVSGRYGTITIDDGGHYTYTLNNSLASVQNLREGATLTESFQLWGTGSSAITVMINGANDRPEVTLSHATLSVTQTDGEESVTVTGTATAQDIDVGDAHTYWLDAAGNHQEAWYTFTLDADGNITGYTSSYTNATDADFHVSITPDGAYMLTYLSGGRHLTEDDTTEVTFTVFTKDDSGSSNAISEGQTITVTINGANAAPVWGQAPSAAVTEDNFPGGNHGANITCSGQFLSDGGVTDDTGNMADSGLSFSINGSTSLFKGQYGTLLITDARTGAYSYTLDNALDAVQSLGVGQTLTETFTIRVTDKHGGWSEKDFTVTVNGSNDAPTLQALSTLSVTARADSTEAVTAQAAAVGRDVDADDTLTYSYAFDPADNGGVALDNYGSFGIDSATGEYFFTLDNSKEAVRNLSDSASKELHFTVTVSDGHGGTAAQDLTVHISGVNDRPEVIAGKEGELGALSHNGDFNAYIQDPDIVKETGLHQQVTFTASYGGSVAGTEVNGRYGSLHINEDGTYAYTPGSSGTSYNETFILHARDPNGAVTDVEITIVNPDGPAPVTFSSASLLGDAPDQSEAGVFFGLLAVNDGLDDLLGSGVAGARETNAPAFLGDAATPDDFTSTLSASIGADSSDSLSNMELAAARLILEHGQS